MMSVMVLTGRLDAIDAKVVWQKWVAMGERWLLCVSDMESVPGAHQGAGVCAPQGVVHVCGWDVAEAGVGDDAQQGGYGHACGTAVRWLATTIRARVRCVPQGAG